VFLVKAVLSKVFLKGLQDFRNRGWIRVAYVIERLDQAAAHHVAPLAIHEVAREPRIALRR
jgi:hypothetical protein